MKNIQNRKATGKAERAQKAVKALDQGPKLKVVKTEKPKAERKSTAKRYKYSGKPLEAGLKGVYGIMVRCAANYGDYFTKADLAARLELEKASKMPGLKNVAWYLPKAKVDGYVVEA